MPLKDYLWLAPVLIIFIANKEVQILSIVPRANIKMGINVYHAQLADTAGELDQRAIIKVHVLLAMFVKEDLGPNIHTTQGLLTLNSKSSQHIMDYHIQDTTQTLILHLIKNVSLQRIKILKEQKPASLALLDSIVPQMV